MRFYLVLFFCGLGFLFSCSDDKGIPGDVIKEHQMALLLTDIHLVDGTIYNLPNIPDTLAKHGLGLYLAVFKMRHTDTAEFKKSLKFYSTRPDLMNEIYDGVTNRLDSLQKAREKMIKPAVPAASQKNTQQLADSVKKVQVKTDSVNTTKEKRKADSLRMIKFRMKMVKDVKDRAKVVRDSIRKAKKHHKKHIKPVIPNAVPN
jgi:hypothetical protein